MNQETILTDKEIEKAFGNAYYGNQINNREVLKTALLKYAIGETTGNGTFNICLFLKLINTEWELTQKGKDFLYYSFCQDMHL